jgi:predicted DNA-binding helix-hairpin-helix protein
MLGPRPATPPRFAPAGQSTQMIVGADAATDGAILGTSENLYGAYRLRRVYYSAFSPIPDAARALPAKAPPLLREHRLYQADWLMRFYGFQAPEIVAPEGMLSLEVDPKLAWALAHRDRFPVDLNKAPKEMLLRVPGLGVKAVERLLAARRVRAVHAGDLGRLHVSLKKVMPFVTVAGHHPGRALDAPALRRQIASAAEAQGSLFDTFETVNALDTLNTPGASVKAAAAIAA